MRPSSSHGFPAAVVALAESLNLHLPPRAGEHRHVTPRVAAICGVDPDPHFNVVQRLRLTVPEVESIVDEVRAFFQSHGRVDITWEVGSSATPAGLHRKLVALGMEPDAPEPLATAMVLPGELPPVESEVVVRRAATFDEYRAGARIFRRCFAPDAPDEEDVEALRAAFALYEAGPYWARFLAFLGDEAVGAADATFLEAGAVLNGSATLPHARKQGVYRALVGARAAEGARRGAPHLVTQAGSMSLPSLAKLGFVAVAEIRILRDRFA